MDFTCFLFSVNPVFFFACMLSLSERIGIRYSDVTRKRIIFCRLGIFPVSHNIFTIKQIFTGKIKTTVFIYLITCGQIHRRFIRPASCSICRYTSIKCRIKCSIIIFYSCRILISCFMLRNCSARLIKSFNSSSSNGLIT